MFAYAEQYSNASQAAAAHIHDMFREELGGPSLIEISHTVPNLISQPFAKSIRCNPTAGSHFYSAREMAKNQGRLQVFLPSHPS